jgi:hypothetical protein
MIFFYPFSSVKLFVGVRGLDLDAAEACWFVDYLER